MSRIVFLLLIGYGFFILNLCFYIALKEESVKFMPLGFRSVLSPFRRYFLYLSYIHFVVTLGLAFMTLKELITPKEWQFYFVFHLCLQVASAVIRMLISPIWLFIRKDITLQRRAPALVTSGLRIAHISDLHLTSDHTLEGELYKDSAYEAAHHAIKWGLERADRVAITGDLVDTGAEEEWRLFRMLLGSFSLQQRERIDTVPGNHDLSLTTDAVLSIPKWRIIYEKRCALFAKSVLAECPRQWTTVGPFPTSVRDLLSTEKYLELYEAHLPIDKKISGNEDDLLFDFPLVVPKELRDAATKLGQGLLWPSGEHLLFRDLIDLVYPMVFYQDSTYLVIGLNSATAPASSMITSGFGLLGRRQMQRLIEFMKQKKDTKCLLMLMHHHVGIPWWIKNELGPALAVRALQLRDAAVLRKHLKPLKGAVFLFHGHKHIRYLAQLDGMTIISSPSVAYGGQRENEANCFLYKMSADGTIEVDDHATIVASTHRHPNILFSWQVAPFVELGRDELKGDNLPRKFGIMRLVLKGHIDIYKDLFGDLLKDAHKNPQEVGPGGKILGLLIFLLIFSPVLAIFHLCCFALMPLCLFLDLGFASGSRAVGWGLFIVGCIIELVLVLVVVRVIWISTSVYWWLKPSLIFALPVIAWIVCFMLFGFFKKRTITIHKK